LVCVALQQQQHFTFADPYLREIGGWLNQCWLDGG
jgi:hypothetical protein